MRHAEGGEFSILVCVQHQPVGAGNQYPDHQRDGAHGEERWQIMDGMQSLTEGADTESDAMPDMRGMLTGFQAGGDLPSVFPDHEGEQRAHGDKQNQQNSARADGVVLREGAEALREEKIAGEND